MPIVSEVCLLPSVTFTINALGELGAINADWAL
jgi:hypothetical protein